MSALTGWRRPAKGGQPRPALVCVMIANEDCRTHVDFCWANVESGWNRAKKHGEAGPLKADVIEGQFGAGSAMENKKPSVMKTVCVWWLEKNRERVEDNKLLRPNLVHRGRRLLNPLDAL